MKILILGGTVFVGRHIVDAALAAGHELTLFHRGESNPELFPEVERLLGDRDRDLDRLAGREWDAVIDTCGYFPKQVADAVAALNAASPNYLFISTISVYGSWEHEVVTEDTPLHAPISPDTSVIDGETYGPLKAMCEAELDAFNGAVQILRPGLIAGPHDPTDRATWWPARFSRGGTLPVPLPKDRPLQFVDARDLAAFAIHCVERGEAGTWNTAGSGTNYTTAELVADCQSITNADTEPSWISQQVFLDCEVGAFYELPIWMPDDEENRGFHRVDTSKAIAHGMIRRTPRETLADAWAWRQTEDRPWHPRMGLSPNREAELLQQGTG